MTSRVLIADDNPQICELLEAYLEAEGVQIDIAADGEEALAKVAAAPPDLLLLDVMMPRRSGFDVCRILKSDARWQDIPIIMVTALNEIGDIDRARQCGADDVVSKPVNKLELQARVRELLARRGGSAG